VCKISLDLIYNLLNNVPELKTSGQSGLKRFVTKEQNGREDTSPLMFSFVVQI
jgi:hypothetical protein